MVASVILFEPSLTVADSTFAGQLGPFFTPMVRAIFQTKLGLSSKATYVMYRNGGFLSHV